MKCKTKKTCATTKCAVAPKAKKVKCENKKVTFSVHAEKGKSVYLAGEFNDWNPTDIKMTFKNGVYTATMKLAAGSYQYKFIVDGAWCADPENASFVPNDQGTFNSVLTVA